MSMDDIFKNNPLTKSKTAVIVTFSDAMKDYDDLVAICGRNSAQIAIGQLVSSVATLMHHQDFITIAQRVAASAFINPKSDPAVDNLLCSILHVIYNNMKMVGLLVTDTPEEWELVTVLNHRIVLMPVSYSVEQMLPVMRTPSDGDYINL